MKPYTRAELTALRTEILDRGWTIESLAKAARIQEALLIEIMKGKIRPTVEIRKDLARALSIDPEAIQ